MIHVGNKIVGISSSGLHSNGYSLVRKICFDLLKLTTDAHIPELGCSLGEELLRPTLIYSDLIHGLLRDLPLNGLAHITGGGITDNLLRIIPGACRVVMKKYSWEVPPIFSFLQKAGRISEPEMMRTFNNGIGLIAVIPDSAVEDIMNRCSAKGIKAFVMGEILEEKKSGERLAWE
jgi:phosphoribosylformylglycinamidine cyclo-ligase